MLLAAMSDFGSGAASHPPPQKDNCISGHPQQKEKGSDRLELTEVNVLAPLVTPQAAHVTNQSSNNSPLGADHSVNHQVADSYVVLV